MDLTFVNSRHLYGLPEHTDSFVLSNTENGEPYRLFNLDVFQFEVDERMALYGGVPFVTSHTPELTSAALWMNAAETWVDIKYTDPEGRDQKVFEIIEIVSQPLSWYCSKSLNLSQMLNGRNHIKLRYYLQRTKKVEIFPGF
jgi:alpha-glucosidase (family GH31 glycosyl hydrolase)